MDGMHYTLYIPPIETANLVFALFGSESRLQSVTNERMSGPTGFAALDLTIITVLATTISQTSPFSLKALGMVRYNGFVFFFGLENVHAVLNFLPRPDSAQASTLTAAPTSVPLMLPQTVNPFSGVESLGISVPVGGIFPGNPARLSSPFRDSNYPSPVIRAPKFLCIDCAPARASYGKIGTPIIISMGLLPHLLEHFERCPAHSTPDGLTVTALPDPACRQPRSDDLLRIAKQPEVEQAGFLRSLACTSLNLGYAPDFAYAPMLEEVLQTKTDKSVDVAFGDFGLKSSLEI
ncbi:hypothetical protein C8R45DRAFT_929940 [Mycena sanguinolenta]|nr:hypothetical protein C8R45DRAFT_929940 [Mycena sanguinolenta]